MQIKFAAEEDEKQKNKQDGDKESLIEESCTPPVKDWLGLPTPALSMGLITSLSLVAWASGRLSGLSPFDFPGAFSIPRSQVSDPEMVFPAVTICNINRFPFSALTDADIYHLANLTGLPPKTRMATNP
ncbi:hypothetical protein F7725_001805 [Dissostichus mawsoni]|uniref:Uncharacterized protein n=1 Tax=Dissostichus mawsoni TaxID=36200 RepID=A0A7J5Y0N8_DISMA|nr:hypothetical protein F7725_001805 [Dissostichus mawsoni]